MKFSTNKEQEQCKLLPVHEEVRKEIFDMQNSSGAAIKPFGLFPAFYKLLQVTQKNKMNRVKARNIADVFSALQNEHFCINYGGKNVDWFYMTLKRWEKYGLGRKAIYNSITALKYWGFIETEVRPHPLKQQNNVRYYKFNLDMLKALATEISFKGNRRKNES